MSLCHKEALDHLLYGINERKGFIAITGGIGTGKTTLCRVLLSHLDATTKSALILNAFISDLELLKAVNQEFGLRMGPEPLSKKDYIDMLNQFLLKNFGRGGNAVLLVDEAQNLSHAVLEQIRMLSNLETEREKLIQIVLVGQSELKELLASPSLRQLNERITVRHDLMPLRPKDIKGYVEHRMVVAGGRGNVRFTDGAYRKIAASSKGNPRRINAVCERTLLIAYVEGKQRIFRRMVRRAIEELHRDMRIEFVMNVGFWKKVAFSSLALLLVITVAGFAGWRLRAHILGDSPAQQETISRKSNNPVPDTLRYVESEEELRSLFLDEKASLTGLFKPFDHQDASNASLSLVSLKVASKDCGMFQKPFRLRLSESSPSMDSCFLLIREITEDGAVALDAEGRERRVTRGLVLNHWGSEISWVYAHEDNARTMTNGRDDSNILEIQRTLIDMGYGVALTGVYDDATQQCLKAFQEDFGLYADGVADFMTRAVLYQMTEAY